MRERLPLAKLRQPVRGGALLVRDRAGARGRVEFGCRVRVRVRGRGRGRVGRP